jgi:hypothetical protein
MSPDNQQAENRPDDPADLLPEQSILSLSEYLSMNAAIGDRTQFEIVYRLIYTDTEHVTMDVLVEMIGEPYDETTDHVSSLIDDGLVQRREQAIHGSTRTLTYYRATSLGETVLNEGVLTLIDREHEFEEAYSSSDPSSDGDLP